MNRILLKLTTLSPLSHNHPNPQQTNSSFQTFNRQPHLIPISGQIVNHEIIEEEINNLLKLMPSFQLSFAHNINPVQFLAGAFISLLPLYFPNAKGSHFIDADRYQKLSFAISQLGNTNNLVEAWNGLSCLLNLPPMPNEGQSLLGQFFQIDIHLQALMLQVGLNNLPLIILIAREISNQSKVKEGQGFTAPKFQELTLPDKISVSLPILSTNMIRNQMLRSPMMERLLKSLDIKPQDNLPLGVERFIRNGGAIAPGSVSPEPKARLEIEHKIRTMYPCIDAMAGCLDSFMLTQGRVKVFSTLIAKEYNAITQKIAQIQSNTSIFDSLTARHKYHTGFPLPVKEHGQNVFIDETLKAGTSFLIEFSFVSHTTSLTKQSVLQAIQDWDAYLGANSGTGYGKCQWEILDSCVESSDEYLDHLKKQQQALKIGLLSGTFTTGNVLCQFN